MEALHKKIAGRKVIACVSGGKDSSAVMLHLQEQGVHHVRCFADTGWESATTYAYLNGLENRFGLIKRVRATIDLCPAKDALAKLYEARLGMAYSPMVRRILKHETFPSGRRKWCTTDLKVKPTKAWLDTLDEEPLLVLGIRREESARRAAAKEWEWADHYDCEVWRPLVDWTETDVIAAHTRNGLVPAPTYLKGAKRLGCWPCIYCAKDEIRLIAAMDDERIAVIRDLEAWLTDVAGAQQRGWFMNRYDHNDGSPMPIDEAVEWSRTAWGGRQHELFAAPMRTRGCEKWGLCDAFAG